MRRLIAGLLLSCLVASSGCGTVWNVLGPREHPHWYGGVENDSLALRSTWSVERPNNPARGPVAAVSEKLLLTALVAIDFPLSFVGDTMSLPWVALSGARGWGFDQQSGPTQVAAPTDQSPMTSDTTAQPTGSQE
jgi:uncharacterized protein YceK